VKQRTIDATIAGLEHSELWYEFWRNPESGQTLTKLIETFMPLVHRAIERISIRLPRHVPADDLLQAALVGLYHAISRFDPAQGISFEAFAVPRLRGAVLDELRASDHVSRATRATVKKIENAIAEWTQEYGSAPDEEQLAGKMGMTPDELTELVERAQPLLSLDDTLIRQDDRQISLQEALADDSIPGPREQAAKNDLADHLAKAFRKLNPREQKILYLYYFEEMRLSEIAVLFEVTEARICQIHGIAVAKLRVLLTPCEEIANNVTGA